MNKRSIGILLIIAALITVLVNRSSSILSDFFGKLACGDSYMQPINGILGDASCGFNMDMYIATFSIISLLIGIILVFISRNK